MSACDSCFFAKKQLVGENHGVVHLHGRSSTLSDEWCVLVWCRRHCSGTASSGRHTNTGWRSSDPGTDCGDGIDCCRVLGRQMGFGGVVCWFWSLVGPRGLAVGKHTSCSCSSVLVLCEFSCALGQVIERNSVGSHWSVLHTFEERLRVDSKVSSLVYKLYRCNAQIGDTLAFRVKVLSGNFLSRCVKADLWWLWVGGEHGKTAGPILRGAARSRTLQEGPNVWLWVGGEHGKTAVPILRGAARSRTLQEGPNVC